MLITAIGLRGYRLDCLDGDIGKVKEFYFDDHYWTIRYLVADTGNWLANRQVLLSPHATGPVSNAEQRIAIHLTRKQIADSPSVDSDKPVSRQSEVDYYAYYGWPMYWNGPFIWGPFPYIPRTREAQDAPTPPEHVWDPHLRSTRDVIGHHVQGEDGAIGHVQDFIIDDETWAIRYLIVATRNWWPGKKVLIAPPWIGRISWDELKVFVTLSRENIKQSPEYTEASLLTRAYETDLHRHYSRRGYWDNEPVVKPKSR